MKMMLLLFAVEHLLLCFPVSILCFNIYLRNSYLDEFFPQVTEERRSTIFAYSLLMTCPVVFILLHILQYQLFLLYNRTGHPWSKILAPKSYKKGSNLYFWNLFKNFDQRPRNSNLNYILNLKFRK
jgi:hypothetical protein